MTPAQRPDDDIAAGSFETDSDWFEHPSSAKRRLEEAAARLFAAKGIDGTTTREIARAAECSEGLIYRYWPSKEALARNLFMAVHRRITAHVRNSSGTGVGIETQARAIVSIYCGLADWQWDRFAFHLLSTSRFLPTPEGEDNPVAATEDLVRAAMDRGEIPKGDPALVTAMALGVVLQAALHKVYGRIEGRLKPHVPALTRAVVAVLKSQESAAA